MEIKNVGTLDTTGKCIRWLCSDLAKEHPESTVWLRSQMLGKTIQMYAFPPEKGTVRFSEPFGSMEFFLRVSKDGELTVTDGCKPDIRHKLSAGLAICSDIDNPRLLDCLAIIRAVAMERFMPGIILCKDYLDGKKEE